MPAYNNRYSGRNQLPLTPPEYSSYSTGAMSAMAYQQAPYSAQPRSDNRSSNTFSDRYQYGWSMSRDASSHFYPQTNMPESYGKLAPILPPLVPIQPPTYEQAVAGDMASYQPRHDSVHSNEQQTQSKTEKPVGGVSATLDYDMDTMTDFVTEMAHGIVQPGLNYHQNPDTTFHKWVHQVLCATRLPSATILLSLQYLALRMQHLSRGDERQQAQFQRQRMLTVALILGSKFLDDNTFINRSWSEVSGIEVKILNYMETDWFMAMDHRLHREPTEQQGFTSWQEHWKTFERQANARKMTSLKLSPIDTNVQFQKSVRPSYSMSAFHSQPKQIFAPRPQAPLEPMRQYDTPAYSQFDSTWLYPLSASNSSPASAPHTGPTTPEYYNSAGPGPAPWTGSGGYSRRTMFGFPPSQSSVPQSNPQPQSGNMAMAATLTAPIQDPVIPYIPQNYNGHPGDCRCYHCCYSPPRNYMHGYSTYSQQPLSVAC